MESECEEEVVGWDDSEAAGRGVRGGAAAAAAAAAATRKRKRERVGGGGGAQQRQEAPAVVMPWQKKTTRPPQRPAKATDPSGSTRVGEGATSRSVPGGTRNGGGAQQQPLTFLAQPRQQGQRQEQQQQQEEEETEQGARGRAQEQPRPQHAHQQRREQPDRRKRQLPHARDGRARGGARARRGPFSAAPPPRKRRERHGNGAGGTLGDEESRPAAATFAQQLATLPEDAQAAAELPPWQSRGERVLSPRKQRTPTRRNVVAIDDIGCSDDSAQVPQEHLSGNAIDATAQPDAESAPPEQGAAAEAEPASPSQSQPAGGAMGFLAHLGEERFAAGADKGVAPRSKTSPLGGGAARSGASAVKRLGRLVAQERAAADRLARQLAERPNMPADATLRVKAYARDGPALTCSCDVLEPAASSPWMAEARDVGDAVVVVLPGKSALVGAGSELRLFSPWQEVDLPGHPRAALCVTQFHIA